MVAPFYSTEIDSAKAILTTTPPWSLLSNTMHPRFPPTPPGHLRHNMSLFDDSASAAAFETQWKISEMVNPDGSVTIRRRVVKFDGTRSVLEEEYPSFDEQDSSVPETPRGGAVPSLRPCESDSESSATTVKTTPSRSTYSSDHSFDTMSRQQKIEMLLDKKPKRKSRQAKAAPRVSEPQGLEPTATIHRRQAEVPQPTTKPSDFGRSQTEERNRSLLESFEDEDSFEKKYDNRPESPVPFHHKVEESRPRTPPSKSVASFSTWGFDENDVSAMSGDSMGYPIQDTSTFYGEEGNDHQPPEPVEEEDDDASKDSEWSLLKEAPQENLSDPNLHRKETAARNPRKPPSPPERGERNRVQIGEKSRLPPRGRTRYRSPERETGSAPAPSETTPQHDAAVLRSVSSDTQDSSAYLHLGPDGQPLVMRQAPVIARPSPTYPLYRNTGQSDGDSQSTDFRDLRERGNLFDTRSLNTTEQLAEQSVGLRGPEECIVSVIKKSRDDKIGIFVGLKRLICGIRLIVSRVAPNGKFAESPIEPGDIVISINGIGFVDDPNPQDARDIVINSSGKITFVVQKRGDYEDYMSMDELSLPSLPYQQVSEQLNPDQSRTTTREVWNKDGSQTVIIESFDNVGRKHSQSAKRRWVAADGSTQDISSVSFNVSGEMSITVKKLKGQMAGLKLVNKEDPRGQIVLSVSQVFPSGLFARTPLSEGDNILSINSVNFEDTPDLRVASSVIDRAEGELTVVALKSKEWFRAMADRESQARTLVETFTIPAPKSKSVEYDDASYGGGSLFGYESSKSLKFTKYNTSEKLGVMLQTLPTRWGALLVATEVVPSSRLAAMGLKEGDTVLSINGVDFRESPFEDRAMAMLEEAQGDVVIEYQRLENVEGQEEGAEVEVTETFKPDGTKCVRTETMNLDGTRLVKIEEIGPLNPVDVAISTKPSDLSAVSEHPAERFGWAARFNQKKLTTSQQKDEKSSVTRRVVVNKDFPMQVVGVSLATMGGALYVTKVSPTGLLIGKPILPGDTILSINNKSFRQNPTVRDAIATILNAPKTIVFEVLKSSPKDGLHLESGLHKRPFYQRLMCKKHSEPTDATVQTGLSSYMHSPNNGVDPFYV